MNKIFKIVFNAARGKMMVVNEATSSVQTGKKAAVTVAVIGALASGVAMGANIDVNKNSFSIKGVDWTAEDNVTINTSDTGYYGVFGYSGDVNVKDLTINSQSGGINLQAQSGAPTTNLTINADNVTINAKKYSAVYNGDANSGSTVTLNVTDKLEVDAPQITVTGVDKNLVINAGTVSADLTGNGMLSYGTVQMNADSIDIVAKGNYLTWNHKNIILNATDGDLNLTGNIFNDVDAVETSLSGKNITINGDIISKGGGTTTNISSEGSAEINGSVTLTKGDSLNIKTGSTTIAGKVNQENGRTSVAKDAQLTITSGDFKDSVSSQYAGAIHNAGTLAVDNATFSNNKVENTSGGETHGGAIYNFGGKTDIANSSFDGNSAYLVKNGKVDYSQGHGGAIYSRQAGAELTITDSEFTDNKAGKLGGAIYLSETTFTSTGNTFEGNEANAAGVMYVNQSNTTFTDNTFTNNKALTGEAGAISLQDGKNAAFTATFKGENTFTGNSAVNGDGGALMIHNYYNVGLTVDFDADGKAVFDQNTAKNGGAIYNKNTLNLANAEFTSNSAKHGGAIFNTATGQVTVTGSSSFIGNQAGSYGGAVYNDGGLMSFDSTEFSGNKVVTGGSDTHGGAINTVGGEVTIANSTFDSNTAYAYNTDGSINYASGHGGAIYARVGAELNISDSTFSGNKAGKLGGAIYVHESKLVSAGNTYEANEANAAGVMYLNGAKDATFSGDTFTGNKALTGEAGVMSFEKSTATFEDSVFSGNTAAGKGGALMVHTTSSIAFNGTNTFSGNTAGGVANDIHNNGIITFGEGSVTHLAGGITGDDVGTLAGAGSIVITDAGATISGQKVIADTLAFSATGNVNDAVGGDIEELSKSVGVQISSMEEGAVMGAVDADGEMQINTKTEALANKVSLAPQMITRIMMNDVRKRMGDLRAAEGTHGVWARYNGGQMSGAGVDADFHMVQVGIDTVPVVDAPRFGVAFSYAQAEAQDNFGTTDMDSFSLAFYGTKMYDNGMFVDVIGRMATMDSDIVNAGAKGTMDNVALSLSGELGWRFDVTDRFFFEPSVEATYTYTNADTFTMTNGGTYELEAVDSLVGRAGFAAGFKCPANKGDIYVRAAVVHEFMGDMTVNSSINGLAAASLEADGKDTWFEYAIGANFNVNKNTYVYADIERTEGAAMDEDWRANVGVRFAF